MTVEEFDGKTWEYVFKHYKPDITHQEMDYILWNETCYPFDDKTTIKQIDEYFKVLKTNSAQPKL